MALDEPRDDDEVVKEEGVTFLINKELYDQAKPINVDFVESAMGSGFNITSSLSAGEGGGGCGSCSC